MGGFTLAPMQEQRLRTFMEIPKLTRIGRDQAGIAIVEVLVSASSC
jgi:hypothetical protein